MAKQRVKSYILGALLCGALAGTEVVAATDIPQLTTTSWRLTGIQAGRAMPTPEFNSGVSTYRYQMVFSGQNLSVRGGCNALNANYQLGQQGEIQLSSFMSTKRACEQPLMAADNELANMLAGMSVMNVSGLDMTLTNGMQSLIFKGTPFNKPAEGAQVTTKFIELRATPKFIQWRYARYNADAIQTNRNAPWKSSGYKGIQGFKPLANMRYIVRVKEVRNGKRISWISDQIIESEDLRIMPR